MRLACAAHSIERSRKRFILVALHFQPPQMKFCKDHPDPNPDWTEIFTPGPTWPENILKNVSWPRASPVRGNSGFRVALQVFTWWVNDTRKMEPPPKMRALKFLVKGALPPMCTSTNHSSRLVGMLGSHFKLCFCLSITTDANDSIRSQSTQSVRNWNYLQTILIDIVTKSMIKKYILGDFTLSGKKVKATL